MEPRSGGEATLIDCPPGSPLGKTVSLAMEPRSGGAAIDVNVAKAGNRYQDGGLVGGNTAPNYWLTRNIRVG
jgi:hypothetical protein